MLLSFYGLEKVLTIGSMNEKEDTVHNQMISECMQVGLAAVREAGPLAMRYFRSPMHIRDKLQGGVFDPVTEADTKIERLISLRLMQKYPNFRVVGEEFGETGRGDPYWIIDPIDGTRSFISGMPTWGILLGLVVGEIAVGGIMHQPFTRETYIADPLNGSRIVLASGEERRLFSRSSAKLDDAILYSTHPSMINAAGLESQYSKLSAICRMQRWGGDCYAFALLASGWIDVVVDGMLQPYDIVPLIPIIEGAGGTVTDLLGNSPINGGTVVAAANRKLHTSALEILSRSK